MKKHNYDNRKLVRNDIHAIKFLEKKHNKIKYNIISFLLILAITFPLGGCVNTNTLNISKKADELVDCKMLEEFYDYSDEEIDNRLHKESKTLSNNLTRSLSISDLNTKKTLALTHEHLAAVCAYLEEGNNYVAINNMLRFGKIGLRKIQHPIRGSYYPDVRQGTLSTYTGESQVANTNKIIDVMIEAFSLMKQEVFKTYRGTSTAMLMHLSEPSKKEVLLAHIKPGDSFTDKGFVSSSMNRRTANIYAESAVTNAPRCVKVLYSKERPDCTQQPENIPILLAHEHVPAVFTIHNAVGLSVTDLSPIPNNEEVILPPNTNFYVYQVNKNESFLDIRVFATPHRVIKRTRSLGCLPSYK